MAAETVTPVQVVVTAAGIGAISNDPLAAFDSAIWPFDTTTTDITNNHTVMATQNGVVVSSSAPKFGAGCLSLPITATATNAWASAPIAQNGPLDILSGTQDFCIDFWAKIAGGSGSLLVNYGGAHVTFGDSGQYGINFAISSSGVQVSSGLGSFGGISNTTPISNNTWVHVALVRLAGRASLYVGGTQVGATPLWSGYVFPTTQPSFVTLGWSNTISGTLQAGFIDEFRVTKGNARYTANFTPPTAATSFFSVSQGYSNGFVDGVPFGSVAPNPALIDTDIISELTVVNSGTVTTPVYNFQVVVEGQMLASDLKSVAFTDAFGQPQTFLGSAATFTTGAGSTYGIWSWPVTGYSLPFATPTTLTLLFEDPNVEFNCDCEAVSPYDTLANVRRKMLIRLGYPNQLTNPPPGIATLVDEFLRDAQNQIYLQLQRAALRTERFFKWTMVPGQRYYALDANDNVCNAKLNPYKITWVGFEDLNKAWYRLDEGIPPEYYTRANINFGWPTRFEIRSCIEVFPAPQAAYTLWVKGDFGVEALVADTDRFTIDDTAVFMLALGNAKAHYGQKDAQLVLTQAGNYTKALVAGSHGTKRYVPNSTTENPLTPPRFLPLGNNQA